MEINTILRSGEIRRYHATPGVPTQSLSTHQWGVAMLLQKFYPHESKEVLLYALTHDVAESATGDMPAPVKRANPRLKTILEVMEERVEEELGIASSLTLEQYQKVKVCDIIESMWYCYLLIRRGNQDAVEPFRNTVEYYDLMPETNIVSGNFVANMITEVDAHARLW